MEISIIQFAAYGMISLIIGFFLWTIKKSISNVGTKVDESAIEIVKITTHQEHIMKTLEKHNQYQDRLTKVEMTSKAAWKRLDEINDKI